VFLLHTNANHRRARPMAATLVRRLASTRRLYSQHNSAAVASGAARMSAVNNLASIGDDPCPGAAATDPVVRCRARQRCAVRYPIPNNSANVWTPPCPPHGPPRHARET
jgi:hypothetical protein